MRKTRTISSFLADRIDRVERAWIRCGPDGWHTELYVSTTKRLSTLGFRAAVKAVGLDPD